MAEPIAYSWQQATDLAGKTAIVTGVASGIGRATALAYAGAGVSVYGADINEEQGRATLEQVRAAGGRGEFLRLDLTRADSIDSCVATLKTQTGGVIDIIASVAGVDVVEPFLQSKPETWSLIVNVNYLGPVRLIHGLLPTLIEGGRGAKIVTVASDAGRVGSTGETVYSGSKGAVIAFTKALARETARYGIRCNCVAPGPTDTPLFTRAMEEPLRNALIKAIPLRRMALPAEIANTILFFSSPAADYITGQVISVSGGLTMHG
ncbi:MAG: SDR family NAD(P)-dependent oxidoreductase [Steroidobacteraceae bacterium]